MNNVFFLFFCILICLSAPGLAGTKHYHKIKYKPLRQREHSDRYYRNTCVFVGNRAKVIKNANLYGLEGIFSGHIVKNIYGGFQIGVDNGNSKQQYGFLNPDPDEYHLSSFNYGVNLTCMIYQSPRMAFMFNLMCDHEELYLGDKSQSSNHALSSNSLLETYKTISINNLFGIRPAIGMDISHRMSAKIAYNFLLGKTEFGQIYDFRGPEFLLYVNNNKHRG